MNIKIPILAFVAVAGFIVFSHAENVNPTRADELLKNPKMFILDVRTRGEYAEGHLKGATLIPIQELKERWAELPVDKNTPVLVYCTVGVRSMRAHRMLKSGGYKNLYHLDGGLDAWIASGRPITAPKTSEH